MAILPRSMADAPDAESRDPGNSEPASPKPEGAGPEGPEKRSTGRRLAVIGTVAGVVLLVGGFFLGRATESESSDDPATTVTTTDTKDQKPLEVLTRACSRGAGPDAEAVVEAFPPIIVTDGQIEEQPEGSPGRAFLEWWQAYQFDDVVAVESLTSESTIDDLGEDNLRALVELPGPGLQGVEVLDVSESGDSAQVNVGLLSFEPEEPGGPVPDEPSNSVPESMAMVNENGDWKFAATEYLSLKLNSLPDADA